MDNALYINNGIIVESSDQPKTMNGNSKPHTEIPMEY